jgi:hypothetical protein
LPRRRVRSPASSPRSNGVVRSPWPGPGLFCREHPGQTIGRSCLATWTSLDPRTDKEGAAARSVYVPCPARVARLRWARTMQN